MKECIHHKFILDGEIVDCNHFDPEMIDTGISIYEVVRVIKGKILFMMDHLDRLSESARLAGLVIWHTLDSLHMMVSQLPALNGVQEGNIKIVFNYHPENQNMFLAYFVSHNYPSPSQYEEGVPLHTYRFTRSDPHTKIWRPKHRMAVKEYIKKKKLYEVLLVDDHDRVTEASKANVFFISGNKIITPPLDLILPGITRKYILQICIDRNIDVDEKIVFLNQINHFDGIFITGTSPGVLPVSCVDESYFNVDHPLLRILMQEFDLLVEKALKSV